MKSSLSLFLLTLFLTTSISHADDYVWGEEFEEGDVISAETFNHIFNTLEKLNRTPKDSDLLGTWSCSSIESAPNFAQNISGWSKQGLIYMLDAPQQLTMTASGDNPSIQSPYTLVTSAPSPFYVSNEGSSATYSLFNGTLYIAGLKSHHNCINCGSDLQIYSVDIVSDDRFLLQHTSQESPIGVLSDYIMCDSAVAVPAAPTATTATNAQTLVNVTWTDNSADETGFKIYRRLSTETEATELATAVTASPYVDSTLTEGQTAYYSVAAYNDNGESAKSKVVNATLDSVKPTVSSHSPTANQQVATTSRTLSINFSENVKVICPAGDDGPMCSTSGSAITAVGSSSKLYGYIVSAGSSGLSLSGNLVGSAETLNTSDTITVTVHKEWIQDANGNPMDADYSYTFTTGS